MKESDRTLNNWMVATLDDCLKSGLVFVTGGRIIGDHKKIWVKMAATVSHDKNWITPFIGLEDPYTTTPDGKLSRYITFEMWPFNTDLVVESPLTYGHILQRSGVIHKEADKLLGSLTSGVVWHFTKAIRFNVSHRIVTCSMRTKTGLLLRGENAIEWEYDEDLKHLFEGRSGPLL